MLTTTIGAYPKPDDVPIRDWFGREGGRATPEPTAGYAETLAAHAGTLESLQGRLDVFGPNAVKHRKPGIGRRRA